MIVPFQWCVHIRHEQLRRQQQLHHHQQLCFSIFYIYLLITIIHIAIVKFNDVDAFTTTKNSCMVNIYVTKRPFINLPRSASSTENTSDTSNSNDKNTRKEKKSRKDTTPLTLGELRRELIRNPAPFLEAATKAASKTASKARRTRKRVDQPKQQYLYASQRIQLQQQHQKTAVPINDGSKSTDDIEIPTSSTIQNDSNSKPSKRTNMDIQLAKDLGMITSIQHCDPTINEQERPKIVASIRISTNTKSKSNNSNQNEMDDDDDDAETSLSSADLAYIIDKPAGWSILGTQPNNVKNNKITTTTDAVVVPDTKIVTNGMTTNTINQRAKYQKRIAVKNEDGSFGGSYMEYNELDVLALMTPEEIEEYYQDNVEQQEQVLSLLSMQNASDDLVVDNDTIKKDSATNGSIENDTENDANSMDPQTLANLRKIAARSVDSSTIANSKNQLVASFASNARPSVISWLKEVKASLGTPIRGGKYWTAIAGAIDVDDTGLVLLCPKASVDNVCIEYVEYIAVIGNGKQLDPTAHKTKFDPSGKKNSVVSQTENGIKVEMMSKLKRGRLDDFVETLKITIPEHPSVCSNVIHMCQEQYQDGIRGDPVSSPFDRRAPRRLIHCNSISVSSLTHDETVAVETDTIPDDIAILSDRRNHLEYKNGSFLGRAMLRRNPQTTAYREINGAADGYPGWTVDRYGDYLTVYHDTKHPKGPLPSIHDGNTLGVYYLESNPDRSQMGTESEVRPRLLEGRPAPDLFPILENGVTYHVSLNRDLSTGIFLDQRLHRAWLCRICGPNTRVLNCFAHTGAFSVAAATTGASTVSLDLSKKWLDRLPDQLLANGIDFDDRHDCIYGDCFDWLSRLSKRNELYDIVILDPPSTSIGHKRKRWSIQDMDELVSLAVPLVKKGGLLFTTTNSASISVTKFARLCHKGLVDAGVPKAKLERIQPMPTDFSSIGPQPVKNLVWRIN